MPLLLRVRGARFPGAAAVLARGYRRRQRACEPALSPLPACGARTTSLIATEPGSLRFTEVQRMVIARDVLR